MVTNAQSVQNKNQKNGGKKMENEKNTEHKMLELLVVEDNPKHMEDAKAYFAELSDSEVVQVTYASNYSNAQQMMKNKRFDGIISDVFIPFEEVRDGEYIDSDPEDNKARIQNALFHAEVMPLPCDPKSPDFNYQINVVKSMNSWCEGKSLMPRGMLIAADAKKAAISIVLCSDAGHHSYELDPINQYALHQDIPLCDRLKENSKDWAQAYKMLKLDE